MAALAFSHLTHVLNGHTDAVRNLAWSPDGALIATASRDRTVRVWDTTGRTLTVLTGATDVVRTVAWSPDGSKIASGPATG